MIPHWAVPGAKVVCITSGVWTEKRWFRRVLVEGPARGEVCTITKASFHKGEATLWLAEYPCREGYWAPEFRPLVDRATDSEVEARIFRARRAPHQEHA